MSTINLLTIHWGNSYGGTLQTYATVKLLEQLGHNVRVINLKHPKTSLSNLYKKGFSRSRICQDLKFFLFKTFTIGGFTSPGYSIDECRVPKCDITIVGSDQVWNKDITSPIHEAYFLGFVNNSNKIAFASSFGKFVWEEDEAFTAFVKNALTSFSAVSVREDSGVEICRNVFNINASRVLDPTLVYTGYKHLIYERPKHLIYPFLLVKNDETAKICSMISHQLSLPIYKVNRFIGFWGVGPKQWLNKIANCDFIITDSFHGLAFSIIFKRDFVVLKADDKKFARLQSLLKTLGLQDRYVESIDDLQARLHILKRKIDYRKVDKILEEERLKSISFLKNSIEKLQRK